MSSYSISYRLSTQLTVAPVKDRTYELFSYQRMYFVLFLLLTDFLNRTNLLDHFSGILSLYAPVLPTQLASLM